MIWLFYHITFILETSNMRLKVKLDQGLNFTLQFIPKASEPVFKRLNNFLREVKGLATLSLMKMFALTNVPHKKSWLYLLVHSSAPVDILIKICM